MAKAARTQLDLRELPAWPKTPPIPVKLIWLASRDDDKAHRFLRQQLTIVARDVA